jgi:hypothetical protein
MLKLDIYKIIDGTDKWPLIETIEAETEEEIFDIVDEKYGPNADEYHWTNPY